MSLTEKRTLSKVSFAIALALTLAIALLYLYNIIQWRDYPDFGIYRRIASGVGIVGVVAEPGRQVGIQVGDHILNVNGKTFKNIKAFRSALNTSVKLNNMTI